MSARWVVAQPSSSRARRASATWHVVHHVHTALHQGVPHNAPLWALLIAYSMIIARAQVVMTWGKVGFKAAGAGQGSASAGALHGVGSSGFGACGARHSSPPPSTMRGFVL